MASQKRSVLFYAIRPCNDLDTIVANGRKQTVVRLFLDAALKTVAYLRVSTRSQDLANQKLAILEFSQKRRFPIDQFIESRISSRQSPLERRIDEMLGTLEPGDTLLALFVLLGGLDLTWWPSSWQRKKQGVPNPSLGPVPGCLIHPGDRPC